MRIEVHRGSNEIGGNCVEVTAADGARLVLDLGRPLSAGREEAVTLPPVQGLTGDGSSLVGVVLTHAHWDHCGLVPQITSNVPVYLGAAADRMLQASRFFVRDAPQFKVHGHLSDRKPLEMGPFRVTPFLADHSAFDAYSLLVEADGQRLFYTGDLRAHGRKAGLFERLVQHPPRPIDYLLMEGTHVTTAATHEDSGLSERDVEDRLVEVLVSSDRPCLSVMSGQNIDRLVTLYRASRRAGRELVLDLYTQTMATATGLASIPKAGYPGLRVYVPEADRRRVLRTRTFERVDSLKSARIFREELHRRAGKLVVVFRQSMERELRAAGLLKGATVIWSLWRGYLDDRFRSRLESDEATVQHIHSSGHAWPRDLARLVNALSPTQVIPIHTTAPEQYPQLFPPRGHDDAEDDEAGS